FEDCAIAPVLLDEPAERVAAGAIALGALDYNNPDLADEIAEGGTGCARHHPSCSSTGGLSNAASTSRPSRVSLKRAAVEARSIRLRTSKCCALDCGTPPLCQSVPEARQKSNIRSGPLRSDAIVFGVRGERPITPTHDSRGGRRVRVFDLHPIRRSPGAIRPISPLRDDAL